MVLGGTGEGIPGLCPEEVARLIDFLFRVVVFHFEFGWGFFACFIFNLTVM